MTELETKLAEALREIVDAADGTGWNQMDAGFSKAREALRLHAEVERLSAAMAATPAPAPLGWKLVPVEPTPEMLWALFGSFVGQLTAGERKRYAAMLAAAPEAATPAPAEPALLAELDRLRGDLKSVWHKAEEAAERRGLKLVMQMPEGRVELLAATPAPAWDAATHKELVSLLCSVADNLDDGGVSPEWEEKTCRRATELLERLGELPPAATPAPAPLGWKLVPVEPTEDMIHAAHDALEKYPFEGNIRRHYRAMLAAAPDAGQGKEASNE